MKKTSFKQVLSALAIVVIISSCGKKSSNNNNNANVDPNQVYARCNGDQRCIEQYMQTNVGPNSQGYYNGYSNCGGYNCQMYTVPHYQNGCNYGCGTRNMYVAPRGAYLPQQGIYGNGGAYYGR